MLLLYSLTNMKHDSRMHNHHQLIRLKIIVYDNLEI